MADTAKIVISAEDQTREALRKIESNFRSSFKQVGESISSAGKVMTAFGAASVAAIGVVTNAINDQQVAERRLTQIATQVTGATEEQIQGFKELASSLQGVGVVGDEVLISGQSQIASFTKSADVVTELSDDLADLAVAQYGVNVSQDQAIQTANLLGKALNGQLGALTKSGILVNDEFKAAFEAANTEQERAIILSKIIQDNYGGLNEALRETAAGGLQALRNQFGDLLEDLGLAVQPALLELIDTIGPLIERLQDWIAENPELAGSLAKIAVVVGTLTAVLGPLFIAIGSIMAVLAGFSGTFLAIIATIGLLVAAFIWLKSNWEEITLTFQYTLIAIKEIFAGNIEAIKNNIQAKFEEITSNISNVLNGIKAGIQSFWESVTGIFEFALFSIEFIVFGSFNALKEFVMTTLGAIKEFFTTTLQEIITMVMGWLTNISTGFKNTWGGIKAFVASAWSEMLSSAEGFFINMKETILSFIEPIKGAFGNMFDGAKGVVLGSLESIKAAVKQSLNFIISLINKVIGGVNKVTGAASKLGVDIPSIPSIPQLAEGGIVTRPTLAMVGEGNEPEAVIPLSKLGAMGGGGTHYHFHDSIISSKEAAMEILDAATQEFGMSTKMV